MNKKDITKKNKKDTKDEKKGNKKKDVKIHKIKIQNAKTKIESVHVKHTSKNDNYDKKQAKKKTRINQSHILEIQKKCSDNGNNLLLKLKNNKV